MGFDLGKDPMVINEANLIWAILSGFLSRWMLIGWWAWVEEFEHDTEPSLSRFQLDFNSVFSYKKGTADTT